MTISLTWNSVLLDDPGKWHHDKSLARLWTDVKKRGESLLLPAATGRRGYDQVLDEIVFDLVLVVRGNKDHAGATHSSLVTGVNKNLEWLGTNVAMHTAIATASLVGPSSTVTAPAEIINWQLARHEGTVAFVSYDLRVPRGYFA